MQDTVMGNRTALVQASFGQGGSGTVTIQGRLSAAHAWVDIVELTTSKPADEVSVFPRMRAVTSDLSSATVVVSITARGVKVA